MNKLYRMTTEEFESILDTVTIFPVTSVELGDISQYSFDCGDAEEYVTFLINKIVQKAFRKYPLDVQSDV